MNLARLIALLLFFVALSAEAAVPGFCGDTTRGKASNACIGINDADGDGYTDDIDCDDTNLWIYPGEWTNDGCSGSQIKKCNTDGTYGSCQALTCSDFSTSNTCKYIDCDSGSDANSGTSGSPWKSLQMISHDGGSTPAGWYDLAPGDTVFVKGTCADYFDITASTSRNAILNLASNQSGSVGNPVTIRQWPGQTQADIDGPFSFGGTHGTGVLLTNADYITFWGIEISDMYVSREFDIYGEGAGDGIFAENGSDNITLHNVYIHDISCKKNYNCSGFEQTSGSDNVTIENSVFFDNYDDQTSTSSTCGDLAGNTNIILFQSANLLIKNTISGYTDYAETDLSQKRGIPLKVKHGLSSANAGTQEVYNNVLFNGCESILEFGGANLNAHNNRLIQSDNWGFYHADLGGTTFTQNISITNNTVDDAMFLFVWPTEKYNTDGSSAADECSGSGTVSTVTATDNVIDDDRASYSQDKSFILVYPYIADDMYTALITGNNLILSDNCYNTAAAALRFGVAEANNGCGTACCTRGNLGTAYASFAAWTGAGFDSGSVNANPTFNTTHTATTNATCIAGGWAQGSATTTTTTTTSTTTSTTMALPAPISGITARYRKGQN